MQRLRKNCADREQVEYDMTHKSMMAGAFALLLATFCSVSASAQKWDLPARTADLISERADKKIKFGFEFRTRFESRDGVSFGKDVNKTTDLQRTRASMTYTPAKWFVVSGMMQDSRVPLYGPNANNTFRDSADLQESWFQLFPNTKKGPTLMAGRAMITYGDGRLIGVPQWSNLARTYDHVRVGYVLPKAKFEMLMVSPVKIQIDNFNNPVLGDRVWGTYNTFPNVFRGTFVEAYWLQHYQNHPGGFTGGKKSLGTDHLTLNLYGARFGGPVTSGLKYVIEGGVQHGKVGAAKENAGAFVSTLIDRQKIFGKPVDFSAEYKYASGNPDPADTKHIRTFDQFYPANHDKFGHQDLLGWRNIHNLRSLDTVQLTKAFAVNVMYDNSWLASTKDSLYNGAGKAIATSAKGTAGRHIGQELDVFATYKYNHMLWGTGYGYFFKGAFIRKATPGVEPTYAYVFQTYSF